MGQSESSGGKGKNKPCCACGRDNQNEHTVEVDSKLREYSTAGLEEKAQEGSTSLAIKPPLEDKRFRDEVKRLSVRDAEVKMNSRGEVTWREQAGPEAKELRDARDGIMSTAGKRQEATAGTGEMISAEEVSITKQHKDETPKESPKEPNPLAVPPNEATRAPREAGEAKAKADEESEPKFPSEGAEASQKSKVEDDKTPLLEDRNATEGHGDHEKKHEGLFARLSGMLHHPKAPSTAEDVALSVQSAAAEEKAQAGTAGSNPPAGDARVGPPCAAETADLRDAAQTADAEAATAPVGAIELMDAQQGTPRDKEVQQPATQNVAAAKTEETTQTGSQESGQAISEIWVSPVENADEAQPNPEVQEIADEKVVAFLEQNGFEKAVNCKRMSFLKSETPLHAAVALNDLEMVSALLEARASLEEKDHLGDTPLQVAQKLDHKEVEDRLRGADPAASTSGIVGTGTEKAGRSRSVSMKVTSLAGGVRASVAKAKISFWDRGAKAGAAVGSGFRASIAAVKKRASRTSRSAPPAPDRLGDRESQRSSEQRSSSVGPLRTSAVEEASSTEAGLEESTEDAPREGSGAGNAAVSASASTRVARTSGVDLEQSALPEITEDAAVTGVGTPCYMSNEASAPDVKEPAFTVRTSIGSREQAAIASPPLDRITSGAVIAMGSELSFGGAGEDRNASSEPAPANQDAPRKSPEEKAAATDRGPTETTASSAKAEPADQSKEPLLGKRQSQPCAAPEAASEAAVEGASPS